jgi:hypothetical protein
MKHPIQVAVENTEHPTRSYSGRGMFGADCLGVTISCSLGSFIADVMNSTLDRFSDYDDQPAAGEVAEAFRSMRTDSMGHDTIVYFPGIPYTVDDAGEDEEEEDDSDLG